MKAICTKALAAGCFFMVVMAAHGIAGAQTLDCEATAGREAARLAGSVAEGQAIALAFGPGYALTLTPASHGWDLSVRDRDGLDLSQMTPPLHGPDPRQIYGWHFRNADNTGPNEGSVNAPSIFGCSSSRLPSQARRGSSPRARSQPGTSPMPKGAAG
jgi:hypothetical protein